MTPLQDWALELPVPPPLPLLAQARSGARTWLALGRGCASRKSLCQLLLASGMTPQVPAGMGGPRWLGGQDPGAAGPQAMCPRLTPRGSLHHLVNNNSCDMAQSEAEPPAAGEVWVPGPERRWEGGGAAASVLVSSLSPYPNSVLAC